jgi:hypothetical protein
VIDDPADPTALGRVLRRRRARARRPRLGDIIDAQAAVLAAGRFSRRAAVRSR